jgi:Tol biopolymer transport system component
MLTGRRAFDGADVHEMLYRIQRDEPAPLRDEAGPLPARVAAIVGKTLRKDAEDRYQCAGDLLVDLRGLLREADAGTLGEVESTTVARAAPASPLRLAAAAAVLLAVGLAAGWLSRVPEAAAPGPVVRLRRILPTEAGDLSYRISSTYNRVLAMAPDGGRFAVVSNRLRLGTLDEIDEMQSLAEGTIRSPAFSPDGTWVAYWKGEALWRVPATGGSELVIAEMTDRPFGLQWGEDGFLYVGRGADGVWRANVGGGDELTQVFVPEPGEFAHGPQLLPGGEWLLMTLAASRTGWESAQIVAVSMRSGERRVLVQPGRDARYVATGHLLWVRDGGLFANRFDPASLQVRGDPWPMATPIRTSTDAETGAAYFAASDTGAFAYIDSPFLGDLRPVWDDGSGELIDSGLPPRTYDEVNLSPDDRLVAATIRSFRGVSVWVYSIGGRGGQDLTPDANSRFPAWSPDGAWVYFASDQEGDFDIWRRRADLSAPAERVYVAEGQQYPGSISADGKQLAFVEDKTGTNPDIYLLELDSIEGDPVVTPVVTDASADTFPIFSQDDRFLAYQSDEGGELTISILEIATGRRWRAGPGYGPRWRGPYLYYLSNGAEPGVQQARVELSPTVSIAEPELFSLRARGATGSRGYDAASDGRILLLYSDAANAADSVIVVLNWPQEMAAANAAR